MNSNINLQYLYNALNFYKERGYKMVAVPMLVNQEISDITLPVGRYPKRHKGDLVYVGSAEQSFYQVLDDYGGISTPGTSGSFMALTPCQRDEDVDDTHLEIFLKLELLSFDKNPLHDAIAFHKTLMKQTDTMRVVSTSENPDVDDIEINGLEVGSYSFRNFDGKLIYNGTGLAMPRISQALFNGENYGY